MGQRLEQEWPVFAREEGPLLPYALTTQLHRLTAGDTVLLYCDRGGLDSMVWAAPLGN